MRWPRLQITPTGGASINGDPCRQFTKALLKVKKSSRTSTLRHERELLRLLAQGELEIEAGKGYDLDTVLAEADEILDM